MAVEMSSLEGFNHCCDRPVCVGLHLLEAILHHGAPYVLSPRTYTVLKGAEVVQDFNHFTPT